MVEGHIRVISEFCSSLLDPKSELYRTMEQKFSNMIINTFKKSSLSESFLGVVIEGFSDGSLKVAFRLVFENRYLPPLPEGTDVVDKAKEIMVEEVLAPSGGEFRGEEIDVDSIVFRCPAEVPQSHRRGPPAQRWL